MSEEQALQTPNLGILEIFEDWWGEIDSDTQPQPRSGLNILNERETGVTNAEPWNPRNIRGLVGMILTVL
jgi:hypothetical protein